MTVRMTDQERRTRVHLRYGAPAPVQFSESELDGFVLFRLIRRRIVPILVITALITAVALPFILAGKQVYTAEVRVMFQQSIGTTLVDGPADPAEAISVDTEIERLGARDNALQVIEQFHLDTLPEFNPTLRSTGLLGWLFGPSNGPEEQALAAAGPIKPIDRVLLQYRAALTVARQSLSPVATVDFASRDPVLAAAVANGIVEVYLHTREAQRQQQLALARDWMTSRIVAQEARVEEVQAEAHTYQQENGVATGAAALQDMEFLTGLNSQRTDMLREQSQIHASLAQLDGAKGAVPAGLGVTETLSLLARDQKLQQTELARLTTTYGPNYPGVVAAQARLTEISAAIQKESATYRQSLSARDQALQANLAGLDARIAAAQEHLSRRSVEETVLTNMLRRVDAETEMLGKLTAQRRLIVAQASRPSIDVEVLSPAAVPLWPRGVSHKLVAVAIAMIAATLALSIVGVHDLLDRTLRSPKQLDRVPGIASIGLLPAASGPDADHAWVLRDPDTPYADALRGAVMSIDCLNGGRTPGSLVITSAQADDGAEKTATDLALSLIATGRRVLLVRSGPVVGAGLTEAALWPPNPRSEDLNPAAGIETSIHRDTVTALSHLPSEALMLHRRLDRGRVLALLELAAKREMLVIFLAPPVLAANTALQLAGPAEVTLLVARWGVTPRTAVVAAANRLRGHCAGDTVLCLIADVDAGKHELYGFGDGMVVAE